MYLQTSPAICVGEQSGAWPISWHSASELSAPAGGGGVLCLLNSKRGGVRNSETMAMVMEKVLGQQKWNFPNLYIYYLYKNLVVPGFFQ